MHATNTTDTRWLPAPPRLPRNAEDHPLGAPLSLVLLSVDDVDDGLCDELLFEALLFQSEGRYRAWHQEGCIAVLRASDELDAVLWAQQIRERLAEHDLRLSAGVATFERPEQTGAELMDRAEWALGRCRSNGGDMVLAYTTMVAVNDTRPTFVPSYHRSA